MSKDDLLPPELLKQIPALSSNEGTSMDDIIIHALYYVGNFTWLVAECEAAKDNDVLFYGYVINHATRYNSEWGYFTLGQLTEIIGMQRDVHFKQCKFGAFMKRGV